MAAKHAWSNWSGWAYNSASRKDERERRCLDATCRETETQERAHVHRDIRTFDDIIDEKKTRVRSCGACGAIVR